MEIKNFVLSLLLLCGVALLMKMAFLADAPVRAAVVEAQGIGWNHSSTKVIVADVSRYGDWPELMLLGAIGFFLARSRQSRKWQRIFLIAMLASTIAGALTNTLRLTTGRTRPRVGPPIEQGWYGPSHDGHWLIGKSEFNSFPSGHTATAIGFATVILLASPLWGSAAMLIAVAIALSRLLLGAHHPSDLLAASFLAIGVAIFLWNYVECRSPRWIERLT